VPIGFEDTTIIEKQVDVDDDYQDKKIVRGRGGYRERTLRTRK
jgi:hypothetical protein